MDMHLRITLATLLAPPQILKPSTDPEADHTWLGSSANFEKSFADSSPKKRCRAGFQAKLLLYAFNGLDSTHDDIDSVKIDVNNPRARKDLKWLDGTSKSLFHTVKV